VVAIGLMDVDDYLSRNPTGSNGTVRLVNIYGFFVEGMGDTDPVTGAITLSAGGKAVVGRLVRLSSTGTSPITAASSFLAKVLLVR
jgi:hypothetical protein